MVKLPMVPASAIHGFAESIAELTMRKVLETMVAEKMISRKCMKGIIDYFVVRCVSGEKYIDVVVETGDIDIDDFYKIIAPGFTKTVAWLKREKEES